MAFLYIGAGWDTYPLKFPSLRSDHTRLILVDALPRYSHYLPENPGWKDSHSEAAFISAITRSLTRDWTAPATVTQDHDHLLFTFPGPSRADAGPCELSYFMNTKDTEMEAHDGLRQLLPEVTTLFIKGYLPAPEAYDMLPNLRRIYADAYICGDLPLEHRGKVMPPMLAYKYDSTDDEYWSDTVEVPLFLFEGEDGEDSDDS
jgi:hypothetical protein